MVNIAAPALDLMKGFSFELTVVTDGVIGS
jgi:hypothetical protein